MGKYSVPLRAAAQSAEYRAQLAMRSFVSEVCARMDERAMSRAQLAGKMKVSPAYVSRALRGDVNFTLESMTRMAMATGGRLEIRIVDGNRARPRLQGPGGVRPLVRTLRPTPAGNRS